MTTFDATYSPEDNKLRLTAAHRLDADTYARVKAAGFKWAPKQEQFIAPAWTPEREDLAMELAGEIGDEDTSLMERAEARAERFEGYHERRREEAVRAREAVDQVAQRFEGGQPIILGHHSTKRALRDKERIEAGMRKAINLWKTSEYWTGRAAAALRHAKYKELPGVRHRRIKTLEAERRKWEREKAECAMWLRLWESIDNPKSITRNGEEVTLEERAQYVANRCHLTVARSESGSRWSAWDVLRPEEERWTGCPAMTPAEIQEIARRVYPERMAYCDRWTEHLDNRLAYERAMLDEQGGYKEPAKPKATALPLLNYSGTVSTRNRYTGDVSTSEAVGLTKAQWAAIHADYKGTSVSACGTHRVRETMAAPGHRHQLVVVYLTDAKQHPRPSAEQVAAKAAEEQAERERVAEARYRQLQARQLAAQAQEAPADPEAEAFEALAEQARAGVEVVTAPQLFPTPADLAARMVDLAEIEPGHRVLEPSAGTGKLVRVLFDTAPVYVVGVEVNPTLARGLVTRAPHGEATHLDVRCADFLACNGDLGTFDRVLMNPPFANGIDIEHIRHAAGMLRPGGVLVALCANGPRQRAALEPLAELWEDLPDGTFKQAGTGVRVALLVIRKPPEAPAPSPAPSRAVQQSLFPEVRP